jgi:glutamate--cysteine ligase
MALANQTAAERKLALFHGEWNGSVDPLFKEFAY